VLAGVWCQLHHLPRCCLSVPISAGGFGIEKWNGQDMLSQPIPKLERPNVIFENMNNYRANQIAKDAKEFKIPLTNIQVAELAQEQLTRVVAADDVPTVSSYLRREWNNLIDRMKIRAAKVKTKPRLTSNWNNGLPKFVVTEGILSKYINYFKDKKTNSFGKYRREYTILQQVKPMLTKARIKISEWLRNYFPNFFRAMISVKGNRAEVMDWLEDKLTCQLFHYTQP